MKKIITLLLASLMILIPVSCGNGKKTPTNTPVNAENGEVTSDVELLDYAEEKICYLFAPEGFEFHENSAENGYNSGRNHIMETPDEDYEIDAGLIAGYDSILYDLFKNGELTGTYYSGMEIDPEDEYKLETKEALDFDVAGNMVYYIERTINGEYFTCYVVFEHIDKDGLGGLYGVDLWSNDEDFYSKENSIKVFKDVYGIGRKESAIYFENAGEEEEEDTYGTLEYVDMVYGSDKLPFTIYKPERGTLELDAEDAEEELDFVWMSSDDYEWTIDVSYAVRYSNGYATDAFVEYYYDGELNDFADNYAYFDAEVYELDIEYEGQPVKVIEYTFAEEDYPDEEETEYFVGVEFEDTFEGEYYGDGLLGFRYYMYEDTPTDDKLASLFCEIFGVDGYEFEIEEEDDEDIWEDDEGFDTDLIVGEWLASESAYEEIFFFYSGDYATYTIEGQEIELEYEITDEGYLYLTFETEQELDYTVVFDGSDAMTLIDVNGNEAKFERI